jgi:hypothetical protein
MPTAIAIMFIAKATALMYRALLSVSPDRVISISPVLVNHSERLMMAPRYLRMGCTLSLSFSWDSHERGHDCDGDEGTTGADRYR